MRTYLAGFGDISQPCAPRARQPSARRRAVTLGRSSSDTPFVIALPSRPAPRDKHIAPIRARWRRECDSCTPDFHLSMLLSVARVAGGWHSASNVDAAVPIHFRPFSHLSHSPLNADDHPRTHQSRTHEGPLIAVRAGPAHSCCSDKEEKFRFGAGCAFSRVALVASVGLQRLNVAPGKTCFEVIQLPLPADMPAFFSYFPFSFSAVLGTGLEALQIGIIGPQSDGMSGPTYRPFWLRLAGPEM